MTTLRRNGRFLSSAVGDPFAGSASQPLADGHGFEFYFRTSSGDLEKFVYNESWSSLALGLDVGAARVVDSPISTTDGVYWIAYDGDVRFYNGTVITALQSADTILRDDFEGVLSP